MRRSSAEDSRSGDSRSSTRDVPKKYMPDDDEDMALQPPGKRPSAPRPDPEGVSVDEKKPAVSIKKKPPPPAADADSKPATKKSPPATPSTQPQTVVQKKAASRVTVTKVTRIPAPSVAKVTEPPRPGTTSPTRDDDSSVLTPRSRGEDQDDDVAVQPPTQPRRATAPGGPKVKQTSRPRRATAPGATAVAGAPSSKRPAARAPGATAVPTPPPPAKQPAARAPGATAVAGAVPSSKEMRSSDTSGTLSLASVAREPGTDDSTEGGRTVASALRRSGQEDDISAMKDEAMRGRTSLPTLEPPPPTTGSFVQDRESLQPGAIPVKGIGTDNQPDSFASSKPVSDDEQLQNPVLEDTGQPSLAIAAEVVDEGINEEERERIRQEAQREVRRQILSEAVEAVSAEVVTVPAETKDAPPPQEARIWLFVALAVFLVITIVIAVVVGVVVGTRDDSDDSSPTPSSAPTSDFPTSSPTELLTNDSCENATQLVLNGVPIRGSTAQATEDDATRCGTVTNRGQGVWYRIDGIDGSNLFRASTCHSLAMLDTVVSVFTGSCNNLVCVDANDQFCGDQSSVWWDAQAGRTYFILVQGFRTDTGPFELTVETQQNDVLDLAETLPTDGSVVLGDTRSATSDFEDLGGIDYCGTGITTPGVWFQVVGHGGSEIATTCHSQTEFDTKVSVFTGSSGNLTCIGGDDNDFSCDLSSDMSTVAWDTVEGETYYVLVHGDYETGLFGFSVTASSQIDNDVCEEAIGPIQVDDSVPTLGSTFGATFDDVGFCGTSNTAAGVWYTVLGTGSVLEASTCNVGDTEDTDYDSKLTVFSGSCDDLICEGGNDDTCGLQSTVIWDSDALTIYYILVHGYSSRFGNFRLNVTTSSSTLPPVAPSAPYFAPYPYPYFAPSFVPVAPAVPGTPPNDGCFDAVSINTQAEFEGITGTTVGATLDDVGNCGVSSNSAPGVWYALSSGNGFDITVSTCSSSTTYDTQLMVFTGDCVRLICIDGNDDTCGLQSSVTWLSNLGQSYFVHVSGFGTGTGNFGLSFNTTIENDLCDNAISLQPNFDNSVFGSTLGAEFDNVGTCSTSNTAPGVWYSLVGDSLSYTATTCNDASGITTDYDSKISVFSGSCVSLTCVTGNDDACSLQSSVTWFAESGQLYLILVHGYSQGVGAFRLNVTFST